MLKIAPDALSRPKSLPLDFAGHLSAQRSIHGPEGMDQRTMDLGYGWAMEYLKSRPKCRLACCMTGDGCCKCNGRRVFDETGAPTWPDGPPLTRLSEDGRPAYMHEDLVASWRAPFDAPSAKPTKCGRCLGPLTKVPLWRGPACADCIKEYEGRAR